MVIDIECDRTCSVCSTNSTKGFTLVEVVLVLIVTSIIALPMGSVLNSASYNFWFKHRSHQYTANLDMVLERMAYYLGIVLSGRDLTVIRPQAIKMRTLTGEIVGFELDGNRKEKTNKKFMETALRKANSLNLTYRDENVEITEAPEKIRMVEIELGVSGDELGIIRRRVVNLWSSK